MLIKLTETRVLKPWGRNDIPEAFGTVGPGERLGEIWFERDGGEKDALLVKYLFTSERLSIQVHPDDERAQGAGHSRGKDEAWLVLDAEPNAEIGIGLKNKLSSKDLRAAAMDGSVVEKLDWRRVARGDSYYSPAGTLHSIGAGLTLLEIQQNCDVTYRLYDFGRPRELHVDEGVAAAKPALNVTKSIERPVGDGRSVLVSGPKFIVERWRRRSGNIVARKETPAWLIPLSGPISANGQALEQPSVWFADEPVSLEVGERGDLLVAHQAEAPGSLG